MSNDKNLPVVKESNTDYHAETPPATIPLQPETTTEMEEQIDILDVIQSCTAYTQLSPYQRMILKQMSEDFVTGVIHTDSDLAEIVGCSRGTVINARKNRLFGHAITEIMPELVKSKLPKYIKMIEKHGERDFQPLKFLMQYMGVYIPTSQQAIITARMGDVAGMDRIKSPQGAIKAVVSQFGALGYTKERLKDEIDVAWDKAKEEGQF